MKKQSKENIEIKKHIHNSKNGSNSKAMANENTQWKMTRFHYK